MPPATRAVPQDFVIYGEGLFYASVCSNLPAEEVAARMHAHLCGTTKGWTPSDEQAFANGEPNPSPCNVWPATHTHYLFAA